MIDIASFKICMGRFATGVAVVTTHFGKQKYGITVSSVCSVSLEPPLLLYCLDKHSVRYIPFSETNNFVINILAEDSAEISNVFSLSDKQNWDQYFANDLEIKGAICSIYCSARNKYEVGDHLVITACVQKAIIHEEKNSADAKPLIYYRGNYHMMGEKQN